MGGRMSRSRRVLVGEGAGAGLDEVVAVGPGASAVVLATGAGDGADDFFVGGCTKGFKSGCNSGCDVDVVAGGLSTFLILASLCFLSNSLLKEDCLLSLGRRFSVLSTFSLSNKSDRLEALLIFPT